MCANHQIICVGMALVDAIIRGFDPEPVSETGFRADSCALHVGGEAVNASIAAAKLGAAASILCALGADAAGDLVAQTLAQQGVDTSHIVRPEDHATPISLMFVNEDGSRRSVTNRAHSYNFHPEQYTGHLAGAGAVILGSLFRAPFDDPAVISGVVSAARASGATIYADTKLPNFKVLTLDDIADSLPLIDFITPNEDEARHFTGKETPQEMADIFLSYGVKNVIIKLGGKGCYFKNAEQEIRLDAHRIHAVDATGAGDHFVAAFASERLRGSTIADALRFANACAAICTTAAGAATALTDRAQVETFLRSC